MSIPSLPLEILDHIADLLHDEPETLEACCLVSTSWIPRTRKHLFARVEFHSVDAIESWKKTFPDPSNSPAHHTRTLLVGRPEVITVADAEEGGWIRTFSRVAKLVVRGSPAKPNCPEATLIPFHGFSPVLESLHVFFSALPNSRIFDLICSLPLLKNLALVTNGIDTDDAPRVGPGAPLSTLQPSTSPAFTGTLDLILFKGMGPVARRLMALPNGLHFRKLALSWIHEGDDRWITALVVGCSDTLECLAVACYLPRTHTLFLHPTFLSPSFAGDSTPASVDLSKATNLQDVSFRPKSMNIEWIVLTLRTITAEHRDLRQISIHAPYDPSVRASVGASVRQLLGEQICGSWLGFDSLLVQFWEVRSIRPRVICMTQHERHYIECLLREITKRGMVVSI